MPRARIDKYRDGFRQIVITLMKRDGHTFDMCELCGKLLTEKTFMIHHTKYEGATIKDLQVVCHKCNTQAENKGLV